MQLSASKRAVNHAPLKIGLLAARGSSDSRPAVFRDPGHPLELSGPQSRFIAAIALPPSFGRPGNPDLPLWTTADVRRRASFDDSVLSRARRDIEQILVDEGLAPADYIRHERGQYGMTNVRIDIVELLNAAEDEGEIDRLLGEWGLQDGAELPRTLRGFIRPELEAKLNELLAHAAERRSARPRRRRRPPLLLVGGALAAALIGAVVVVILVLGSSSPGRSARIEYAGSTARTRSDYQTGGGAVGTPLPAHEPIKIICRVRGLRVPNDGNPWWYLIGSQPWNGRYYASADAFYNERGVKRGSLHDTPFVDRGVSVCVNPPGA